MDAFERMARTAGHSGRDYCFISTEFEEVTQGGRVAFGAWIISLPQLLKRIEPPASEIVSTR